ncbi:MAG TPA: sulfotransferase [Candidatus Binataceae bacterium]|nr:sulfotransferase [Candidatus Binataceae bacterium]
MSRTRWGLLPDFLGIGPARTGTTWLHEKLLGHVDLPRDIKETKFFERYHSRGVEWYASLFKHCKGDRPIAEICPYLAGPRAPEWIAEIIPNCKFIVTLRDPVDRMYSHYKMMRGYAFTRLPVEEALQKDRFLAQGSLYARNLERWFSFFPRDRFLVTLYDDLRRRPQAYLDSITDFVGAGRISLAGRSDRREVINSFDRAPRNFKIAQNARHLRIMLRERDWNRTATLLARLGVWSWCAGGGEKFPPLSAEQDAHFRAMYLPEIEELERLLGFDLSGWKTARGRDDSAPVSTALDNARPRPAAASNELRPKAS